jgi:ribonuclease HI
MKQIEKITIYTDGAAKGNPGRAGWGAVIIFHDDKLKVESKKLKVIEIGGGVDYATNNQMELTAPIEALKYIQKHKIDAQIEFYSDSKYVILGITEWIFNWQKNNWRNAAKKPVVNRDLWEELYDLTQEFKPKWTYVEGHAGHEYNERADVIATSHADGSPFTLLK